MRFVPVVLHSDLYLAPFDQAARLYLAQRTNAEPVELGELHDMHEHKKIFAQIGDVAKALGRDPERLRLELLFETGNFEVLGEVFGKHFVAVNSMTRHAMKDRELTQFAREAREVMLTKLVPNVSDAAERQRLAAMLSSEVG